MIGAREPSIGLGATPQTLLTLVPRPWERITWQAIRSVWIGIGHPNRLCEPDSEKKFQQGESMVDVLAVAIFVHQESVALALRGTRVRSNRVCTKSLFHRFFFDVSAIDRARVTTHRSFAVGAYCTTARSHNGLCQPRAIHASLSVQADFCFAM